METIMTTERQEAYDHLEQLIFRHNLKRDTAMDAAEIIGPAAVNDVIEVIATKNEERDKKDLPKIGMAAAFRQNIRKAISEYHKHKDDIELDRHRELVIRQAVEGYSPQKTTIWKQLDDMKESGKAEENGFSAHDVARGKAFLERLEYMEEAVTPNNIEE